MSVYGSCDRDRPNICPSSSRLSRSGKAWNGGRGNPWLDLERACVAPGWPGRWWLLAFCFIPQARDSFFQRIVLWLMICATSFADLAANQTQPGEQIDAAP